MAEAFTAGVRPGGLTDDTQIRMLLCYLVKVAGKARNDAGCAFAGTACQLF